MARSGAFRWARESLPTVRASVQRILAVGGKLDTKDVRLVVSIPNRLAPDGSEHDRLHAELVGCVRVLMAASDVLVGAVSSRSTKPLDERLPDVRVLAGGGVAP